MPGMGSRPSEGDGPVPTGRTSGSTRIRAGPTIRVTSRMEVAMPSLRLVGRTDPWWDLEGRGARRTRMRLQVESVLAFALAVGACGLTAAAWIRLAAPVILARLG